MIAAKLIVGALFFLLGWVCFYKPNLVLYLNKIGRDILFNDRRILFERKKLAILFFCLSFIALYMGTASLSYIGKNDAVNAAVPYGYAMYAAMQDYCAGHYEEALEKYQKILRTEPQNVRVLKRIAHTYGALGQASKSRTFWQQLYRRFPNDKEIQDNIK